MEKIICFGLILSLLLGSCFVATARQAETLTNLFDKTAAQAGWVDGDGASSPDGGFTTSVPVTVTAGDVVTFGAAVATQGWHLALMNTSQQYVGTGTLSTGVVKKVDLGDGTAIMEYTVPEGVAYIRFVADTKYKDLYLVTKNASFSKKEYYDYFGIENTLPEVDKTNPLYNKTGLFCGDSISYGSSDSIGGRAWAGRIADSHGMLSDNRSQSGWSVSTIRGARIIEQVRSVKNNSYDYVVLHGGVNDAWGDGTIYADPGVMVESYDPADFDIDTYAGALEELFYYTYEYFPMAKIGYIINFATPVATTIGHLADMEPYYSQALAICKKWGVHCLDLYHNDYVNDTLLEVTTTRYMADCVHPNAAGYDRLAPYIADWMVTFTENDTSAFDAYMKQAAVAATMEAINNLPAVTKENTGKALADILYAEDLLDGLVAKHGADILSYVTNLSILVEARDALNAYLPTLSAQSLTDAIASVANRVAGADMFNDCEDKKYIANLNTGALDLEIVPDQGVTGSAAKWTQKVAGTADYAFTLRNDDEFDLSKYQTLSFDMYISEGMQVATSGDLWTPIKFQTGWVDSIDNDAVAVMFFTDTVYTLKAGQWNHIELPLPQQDNGFMQMTIRITNGFTGSAGDYVMLDNVQLLYERDLTLKEYIEVAKLYTAWQGLSQEQKDAVDGSNLLSQWMETAPNEQVSTIATVEQIIANLPAYQDFTKADQEALLWAAQAVEGLTPQQQAALGNRYKIVLLENWDKDDADTDDKDDADTDDKDDVDTDDKDDVDTDDKDDVDTDDKDDVDTDGKDDVDTDDKVEDDSPKTGEHSPVLPIALLAIISGSILFAARRRRATNA